MANTIIASGNLGTTPELTAVTVDGEQRQVADMRVYFDRPVPDGDGGFEDKGGFWRTVSVWDKRAEHAARILRGGMGIRVEGTEVLHTWEQHGEPRSQFQITAHKITLELARVESVAMRPRQQPPGEQSPDPESDNDSDASSAPEHDS